MAAPSDSLQVVVARLGGGPDTAVEFLPHLVLGVDLAAAEEWNDVDRGTAVARRLPVLLERHFADAPRR